MCDVSSATITASSPLSLGSHTLIAIQSNIGGTSTASGPLTFTLSSAPVVVASGGGGGGGGFSGGGGGSVPQNVSPSTTVTSTLVKTLPVKNLSLGSTGYEVLYVQNFLNSHGFKVAEKGAGSPGMESVYFGPATINALKKFQKAQGLSVTGTLNEETTARINELDKVQPFKKQNSATFSKNLSLGSKGTEVSELQKKLKFEGFYSGPIDGNFGNQTKLAVAKYQKAKKIKTTKSSSGVIGPITRALLNR
jgi:peptidoglycan hydrolase-like protein with peptidoglycan-binding domain